MAHLIHSYTLDSRRIKMKEKIITIGFVVILLGVFLGNIIKQDESISVSERRKLAQFPQITLQKLLDANVSDEFEEYAMDQFIGRDSLRGIKNMFHTQILRQKDNNGLFLLEDCIYKIEYPLNKASVEKSAKTIQNIYQKYLQGRSNVYYAIIPDKNYFLPEEYLKMDYEAMKQIIQKELGNLTYIDLFSTLTIQDYYKTDTHWKQENIMPVVNQIEKQMNLPITSKENYTLQEAGDFYGVYYGQLGLPVEPDTLRYLTNETIEKCITQNIETQKQGKVYDLEKYQTSSDKYDIFLSGATPLITIENPDAKNNQELLLFRDSFGSSIAPLFINHYQKITLIDIRYMSSQLLDKYVDFTTQDVLFLYSALVFNQNILK